MGHGDRQQRRIWVGLAGLAAATGIVTIVVASDPRIDVWFLLQQSSQGLLHGDDMYRQHWEQSFERLDVVLRELTAEEAAKEHGDGDDGDPDRSR